MHDLEGWLGDPAGRTVIDVLVGLFGIMVGAVATRRKTPARVAPSTVLA